MSRHIVLFISYKMMNRSLDGDHEENDDHTCATGEEGAKWLALPLNFFLKGYPSSGYEIMQVKFYGNFKKKNIWMILTKISKLTIR